MAADPTLPRYPDLAGKVILITGASSGIGAATAERLADQGARLVLAARRRPALDALAERITAGGGEALAVVADVAEAGDMAALVERTLAHFGRLDGAFNNAGTLGPAGSVETVSEESYQAVFAANIASAFHALRYQVPALKAAGGGSIVFTASIAGVVGFAGIAPYVASKHALIGLTRTAALDLGPAGIRVNALCPGVVATPMSDLAFGDPAGRAQFAATTPAGRAASPVEIAEAACFLLSSAASFINGQPFLVDGGYTAV